MICLPNAENENSSFQDVDFLGWGPAVRSDRMGPYFITPFCQNRKLTLDG